LKIVFMGTPRVAIPSLEGLVKSGETILAVVTQPDRPVGRKQILTPPPVKDAAQKHQLTVLQPEKAKDPAFIESIRALHPDVIVVIAYGQLLRPALLEIPRLGCVNIHASLLPKYRGAAPAQWAIINGEKETGVTAMLMDAGLDTGPILIQAVIPIAPDETSATLLDKMSLLGAKVLLETLEGLKNGTLKSVPQDSREATMAPILKKEDGLIRWTDSAE
jgi:methionyl-tRNA formyltransferase